MTASQVLRFFMDRPFEPFTLTLVTGREVHIQHPEQAGIARYAEGVVFSHPTRQVEVIDFAHVVSVRTIYPVDLDRYRDGGPDVAGPGDDPGANPENGTR